MTDIKESADVSGSNTSDEPLQSLILWATHHGAEVHQNVLFARDSAADIYLQTRPDALPIPAGSRLVTCPYSLSISYLNALDSPLFPSRCEKFPESFLAGFPKQTITAFVLAQQFLLKAESFWWPYIRCLPQPDEPELLGTPLHFTAEDLLWLNGTNLGKATVDRRVEWRERFTDAVAHLKSCGWDVGKFTWSVANFRDDDEVSI